MKQIEQNKSTLLQYGISEELANKIIANGYNKTKLCCENKKDLLKIFSEDEVIKIKEKLNRAPIDEAVFERLVKETDLHCPFCWNLSEEKPIIIHHIDPYHETQDNSFNNLIVLCLNHHAEVHTIRGISQNNYPKVRLLVKKQEWIDALADFRAGKRPAPGLESAIQLQKAKIDIVQNLNGKLTIVFKKCSVENQLTKFYEALKKKISDQFERIKNSSIKDSYKVRDINGNTLSAIIHIQYTAILLDNMSMDCIKEYAKDQGITLCEDFFNLGQLESSSLPRLYNGDNISGTKEEKSKYELLKNLSEYVLISKYLKKYIQNFTEFAYVNFVVSNNGSTFDEDIEIKMYFDKDSILTKDKFPLPEKSFLIKYSKIIENVINYLFDTKATHEIDNFPNIITKSKPLHYQNVSLYGKSEDDILNEKLEDYLFVLTSKYNNYSIFNTSDDDILKFKQGYLKQNTANNFPSIILFNNNITKIKYSITTKNNPNVISNIIYFE